MKKITKRGLKARKTWAKKQYAEFICECRGHREVIDPNDCMCSPHDAEDLRKCKQHETNN